MLARPRGRADDGCQGGRCAASGIPTMREGAAPWVAPFSLAPPGGYGVARASREEAVSGAGVMRLAATR